MMITTPPPAAKPAPAPAPAPAAPAPSAPSGSAPAAPPTAGQAKPGAPQPTGGAPAADAAAAAKQAAIEQLQKTSAVDAIAKVDERLKQVASLSVGGGTPEGQKSASVAASLLTDASMLLQHAHTKAMEQLRTMAAELHMRLMGSASGLAFIGGQVALAGSSKEVVKLADVIAKPMAETEAAMAEVVAAIAPKDAKPQPEPAPAPAK